MTSHPRVRRDATLVVALAAAMWGLDGLLRVPLTTELGAATIVLWEHLIAVVVLLPFLPGAVRALVRCSWRDRIAVAVIGVGASAVATALFTQAFELSARSQDFVTPLVLQKLQPVFAVALAVVVLRERPRAIYAAYIVPALVGAWLLTFSDPLHVQVTELAPAAFAVGAAALWGGGTVLGRLVSPALTPRETTTLRYAFGLLGAIAVTWVVHAPVLPGWSNLPGLIGLALIPGVLALLLYYYGLRSTPASRATLAELAFPATAAVVGVVFLDSRLAASQWVGLAVIVVAVAALSLHESRRPAAVVDTAPIGGWQQPADSHA